MSCDCHSHRGRYGYSLRLLISKGRRRSVRCDSFSCNFLHKYSNPPSEDVMIHTTIVDAFVFPPRTYRFLLSFAIDSKLLEVSKKLIRRTN